jgi:hypothetical protein
MAFALLRSLGNLLPTRRGPSVRVEKQLTLVEKQRQILEEHRNSTPTGRLKTAFGKGLISQFWFLPYHDQLIGETPAMRAAYRLMLRSSTVKTGLYSKILSVASLDYQIQPDIPDSPRDLEACEFLKYNISRTPMGMFGLVHTILTHKLVNGHQLSEPVLDMEREDRTWRGKVVLADLKPKHPDTYDLQCDEYSNPAAVKGRGPNAGDVWPISDFVYSRYLPLYDDPLGTSDLRSAYQPYFMRDTVTKLRAIHAEKYTSPFMVGQYGNQDDKPDLEDALARARSNSWIAIPVGTQIEAKSIATSGESDYKSFIDDCDKQMLIGIVGAYLQILEGQVQDGRGSASVSKTVSELFQWLLAVIFQEVINKQLFPLLMRLNYAGIGVPRLTLGGVSEDEIAKIIANMQGAQALGLKLSQKDAYTRLSMQPPLGPDDELTAATVTQLQTQAMQMPDDGSGGGDPFAGGMFAEDRRGTYDQFGRIRIRRIMQNDPNDWRPHKMANGQMGWISPNGLVRATKPTTMDRAREFEHFKKTNPVTDLVRKTIRPLKTGQLSRKEVDKMVAVATASGASPKVLRKLDRLRPERIAPRIAAAKAKIAAIPDKTKHAAIMAAALRGGVKKNDFRQVVNHLRSAGPEGKKLARRLERSTQPASAAKKILRAAKPTANLAFETILAKSPIGLTTEKEWIGKMIRRHGRVGGAVLGAAFHVADFAIASGLLALGVPLIIAKVSGGAGLMAYNTARKTAVKKTLEGVAKATVWTKRAVGLSEQFADDGFDQVDAIIADLREEILARHPDIDPSLLTDSILLDIIEEAIPDRYRETVGSES